ncbi:hypothetical protein AMTR_s00006p00109430 [Amborella trichopoda]|uniref:Uncharacterized protein n=1 Tax=Amborella trichopoda TaxID=13333 RepID=W1P6X3_AMBTC|nr:hypothetical protein AMTR_s00006p00109430 [Amborella trichopoda]
MMRILGTRQVDVTKTITSRENEEGLHPNTYTTAGLAEAEKTYSTTFTVLGLGSSSEEAAEIASMISKEFLDAGVFLDPKSTEIADPEQMVARLLQEPEHHQNMFDFYRG